MFNLKMVHTYTNKCMSLIHWIHPPQYYSDWLGLSHYPKTITDTKYYSANIQNVTNWKRAWQRSRNYDYVSKLPLALSSLSSILSSSSIQLRKTVRLFPTAPPPILPCIRQSVYPYICYYSCFTEVLSVCVPHSSSFGACVNLGLSSVSSLLVLRRSGSMSPTTIGLWRPLPTNHRCMRCARIYL